MKFCFFHLMPYTGVKDVTPGFLKSTPVQKEIGKPAEVMGAWFGGAVALWLAIEHPDCVDHLVLECPGGLQSIDAGLRRDPLALSYA